MAINGTCQSSLRICDADADGNMQDQATQVWWYILLVSSTWLDAMSTPGTWRVWWEVKSTKSLELR